jgi:hypothetical protein
MNLSCGKCRAIRSFSGWPPVCDECGWVYREPAKKSQTKNGKTDRKDNFLKGVLGLSAVLGAFGFWYMMKDSGFIPHDELTIVGSSKWQVGEYKVCQTVNGNGDGAPEKTKGPQNIFCNGDTPSDLVDTGKTFKVRFEGKTYVYGQKLDSSLVWDCRKNVLDPNANDDPAITCKQP